MVFVEGPLNFNALMKENKLYKGIIFEFLVISAFVKHK